MRLYKTAALPLSGIMLVITQCASAQSTCSAANVGAALAAEAAADSCTSPLVIVNPVGLADKLYADCRGVADCIKRRAGPMAASLRTLARLSPDQANSAQDFNRELYLLLKTSHPNPEGTPKPQGTKRPEATKSPEPTKAPEPTKSPEPTPGGKLDPAVVIANNCPCNNKHQERVGDPVVKWESHSQYVACVTNVEAYGETHNAWTSNDVARGIVADAKGNTCGNPA